MRVFLGAVVLDGGERAGTNESKTNGTALALLVVSCWCCQFCARWVPAEKSLGSARCLDRFSGWTAGQHRQPADVIRTVPQPNEGQALQARQAPAGRMPLL